MTLEQATERYMALEFGSSGTSEWFYLAGYIDCLNDVCVHGDLDYRMGFYDAAGDHDLDTSKWVST